MQKCQPNYCKELIANGYPCALMYATQKGVLKTYGSKNCTDQISRMGQVFCQEMTENEINVQIPVDTATILPELPGELDKLNAHSLRHILLSLVQADRGAGDIGWGKTENKPEWWPSDVTWSKTGIQSGISATNLRQCIRLAYAFFGHEVNNYHSS